MWKNRTSMTDTTHRANNRNRINIRNRTNRTSQNQLKGKTIIVVTIGHHLRTNSEIIAI